MHFITEMFRIDTTLSYHITQLVNFMLITQYLMAKGKDEFRCIDAYR